MNSSKKTLNHVPKDPGSQAGKENQGVCPDLNFPGEGKLGVEGTVFAFG